MFYKSMFLYRGSSVLLLTAICFMRGAIGLQSIYLSFTSFYLHEEGEPKVLGVTDDEDIAGAKKKQNNNNNNNNKGMHEANHNLSINQLDYELL